MGEIHTRFVDKGWIGPDQIGASTINVDELFETKSKNIKTNDKVLFESWRRYLGK